MAARPPPAAPPSNSSSIPAPPAAATSNPHFPPRSLPSGDMNTRTVPTSGPRKADEAIDIRTQSPLPLTASQEGQVRELYYKNVRNYCADEIRDFAQCTAGRTVSITWACRTQRSAMNTCMLRHATREEEDKAREEWFATIPQRKKEAEEKERLNEEVKRQRREWWEMDEQGRRIRPEKRRDEG